jgi:hypothetical protein
MCCIRTPSPLLHRRQAFRFGEANWKPERGGGGPVGVLWFSKDNADVLATGVIEECIPKSEVISKKSSAKLSSVRSTTSFWLFRFGVVVGCTMVVSSGEGAVNRGVITTGSTSKSGPEFGSTPAMTKTNQPAAVYTDRIYYSLSRSSSSSSPSFAMISGLIEVDTIQAKMYTRQATLDPSFKWYSLPCRFLACLLAFTSNNEA